MLSLIAHACININLIKFVSQCIDGIIRTLGEGTFGKVVQVRDTRNNGTQLALKVIKNVAKYREAARLEINVLNKLKERDPDGRHLVIQASLLLSAQTKAINLW